MHITPLLLNNWQVSPTHSLHGCIQPVWSHAKAEQSVFMSLCICLRLTETKEHSQLLLLPLAAQ